MLFPGRDKAAGDSETPSTPVSAPSVGGHDPGSERRQERNSRRELLYAVVRECMLRAGVLSSGYKFKVLTLDSRGLRYLVMVDLLAGSAAPASEHAVEADIVQVALQRHSIEVAGVYWRQPEPVDVAAGAAGASRRRTQATLAEAAAAIAIPATAPAAALVEPAPAGDELAALQHALAEDRARPVVGFDGHPVHGPQSYTLLTGFEDTEIDGSDVVPPLGNTQYGEPT